MTARPAETRQPSGRPAGGMCVHLDGRSVTDARDCSLPAAQCLARYASLVNLASIPGTPQAWTRRLLHCGVAAGPVFVAVSLLEGAVRDGYRPLRHPVSSLALGQRGRIQAGNFAMAGTLFLAGAAGLARAGDPAASRGAPALTGAAGAGLTGSAVFTTDPVSGYPPGTPDALTRPTRTRIAHNLAAGPGVRRPARRRTRQWLAVLRPASTASVFTAPAPP